MYYAETDTFTGNDPKEHTHGFANTKSVLAFNTKKERDEWVKTTKLLTASPLTRAQAIKLADIDDGNLTGHNGARVAEIYGTGDGVIADYHLIQKSRSKYL